MASILVTGGGGFVAAHLVPALRAAGHRVHAPGREAGDVTARDTWRSFAPAEVVVHLAARTFVPDSWAEPAAVLHTNLCGTAHALEFARTHGARVVFMSSYLYGEPRSLPVPESAPLVATNPYALSKQLAEQACRFHAGHFGVPVVVLRPFNIYGPGQGESFLIPSIVRQALSGAPIRVKDLAPRRDYVHVRDVVRLVQAAATAPSLGGYAVYNVGSGTSRSVSDVIGAVQAALGTALRVESAEERRPGELMDTVADVSAARRDLGWAPSVPFEQGIAELCRRAPPEHLA